MLKNAKPLRIPISHKGQLGFFEVNLQKQDAHPKNLITEIIDENSDCKYAYSLDQFNDLFKKIGDYAKKYNHRITFHPDHSQRRKICRTSSGKNDTRKRATTTCSQKWHPG